MKRASIYVHIPFCVQKCTYCDFASYAGCESLMDAYLDALIDDMAADATRYGGLCAPTAFIGGGTPTLLSTAQLARLLTALQRYVHFDPDAEITMEANPGTVTPEKLRAMAEGGVRRISLGAQAAQAPLLQTLGRIHRWADVESAVASARAAGFTQINLDLMYALPGQTLSDWRETLQAALTLQPTHLSAYSLIVEAGTPLAARVANGEWSLPSEDTWLHMQKETVATLRAAGYERYEISNYARAGSECRHNIVYWTRADYMGWGCAAHSLMDGVRFHAPERLDAYLAGERRLEETPLTPEDERIEAIMLGTRLTRGIDYADFAERYGHDIRLEKRDALTRLIREGLIFDRPDRLALTEAGFNLHNLIVDALT